MILEHITDNQILMKRYIVSFLLILGSVSVFAQKPHTTKDLLGKWEGRDSRNEVGGLTFRKDNTLLLSVRHTDAPPMKYIVDFSSNPAKIDMVVQNPNNNSRINMMGLLQFVDGNTLKFQIFPNGIRPGNFDLQSKQTVLILKRVR